MTNRKILIIEDDAVLGQILEKKLVDEGYTVTLIADGAIGLKTMRESKPDLVLLDILLPTLNGYEILEAKRDDVSIKEIPVIIISNSGQPVELQRTLELGALDYFIKAQLDPNDIASKVHMLAPLDTENIEQGSLLSKKILLVEDDTFLSDVLTKKLSNEKCTVFHATSGEMAIEMSAKELPDLVLLDLVLPGINGFDTLAKIKENPTTKNSHVIILSNLSQQEDIERAKSLGADAFLVKAVSTPTEIFSTIKSILLA
jgi:CheY-like chemotaxis protein